MGVPASRITRKMLMEERDIQIYKRRNKDDMNTVVDLNNIAHKEGKLVGGIEDVNDQLGLVDEMGKDFIVNEILDDSETNIKNSLNQVVDLYLSEDIDKIEEWVNGQGSAETKDLLLTKRNIKMARRMDSLSKLRITFFAVGTAHLPGDSGVISLLDGKTNLFPEKWQTQKLFAESYLYDYINEEEDLDDESLSLSFIAEKVEKQKGKQYRYLLFKATIDNGDDKEMHLAICRPFDFDKSKVLINTNDEKEELSNDEPYSPSSNDKLFKAYLENSSED